MDYLTTNDSGDNIDLNLTGMDREDAAREMLQALVEKTVATAT
jgi:hypothetical protein